MSLLDDGPYVDLLAPPQLSWDSQFVWPADHVDILSALGDPTPGAWRRTVLESSTRWTMQHTRGLRVSVTHTKHVRILRPSDVAPQLAPRFDILRNPPREGHDPSGLAAVLHDLADAVGPRAEAQFQRHVMAIKAWLIQADHHGRWSWSRSASDRRVSPVAHTSEGIMLPPPLDTGLGYHAWLPHRAGPRLSGVYVFDLPDTAHARMRILAEAATCPLV